MTHKIITVPGWLSDDEISKGKLAIWNSSAGEVEEVIDFLISDYEIDDKEMGRQLCKAQNWVDEQIKEM